MSATMFYQCRLICTLTPSCRFVKRKGNSHLVSLLLHRLSNCEQIQTVFKSSCCKQVRFSKQKTNDCLQTATLADENFKTLSTMLLCWKPPAGSDPVFSHNCVTIDNVFLFPPQEFSPIVFLFFDENKLFLFRRARGDTVPFSFRYTFETVCGHWCIRM